MLFSSRLKIGLKSISAASMLLFLLTGCSSGPKTFEIRGEADQMINRDSSGNPLSVVIHVYQLEASEEFSKMTFDTLASGRPPAELLGKDLLEKNEVLLVPGAIYTSTEKLREEAKHIGVVAFFRHPEQHYWRFLVDANAVRKNGLQFKVRDCFLSLTEPKPRLIPGQPENAAPVCNGGDPRATGMIQSRQSSTRQPALSSGRRSTAAIKSASN